MSKSKTTYKIVKIGATIRTSRPATSVRKQVCARQKQTWSTLVDRGWKLVAA
jgi:hypothetical protein